MSWQTLRGIPQQRSEALGALVTLSELAAELQLAERDVYWLISTRKLPAWLVEGAWRFHPDEVSAWMDDMGGPEGVRADVASQIAQHGGGPTPESPRSAGSLHG
jgi:hypothetical protein